MGIDYLLLTGAILLLISILIAKSLDNIGIPTLLLFIGIGMLAGSEGIGGIYFDDPNLAQSIGIISLVFILFSGGLDTNWKETRVALKPAFTLATLGVVITAVIIALFVMLIFNTTFLLGLLIGSIISSTDAAAVFSILRIGNVNLKNDLKPTLELESGSNDPMAVFLTVGTIDLLLNADKSFFDLILFFILQFAIGGLIGFSFGKLMVYLVNKLKFSYEGIYPVFALGLCFLVYSIPPVIGGSGFLAIYISGIIVGNSKIVHQKALVRFFDGLAVLSQIAMFLTLGLLVFPSRLLDVVWTGLLVSGILIFVARPLSVLVSLIPFKYNLKEKTFISWVGLRGAVPIILATFPLIMGVQNSNLIFNLVFFVVLTSSLIQGWTLKFVANKLGLSSIEKKGKKIPIEFTPDSDLDTELIELSIDENSAIIDKQIIELNFPDDCRIILIWRDNNSIVPSGGTTFQANDKLLILISKENRDIINQIFAQHKS